MPGTSDLAKAELHVHIEGTLEPDMVFRFAARHSVDLPFANAAELRRAHQFSDLQSFLDLYFTCTDVLRDAADFYELCEAYLRRARADGVRYAEISFDPQAHTQRGIPLGDVLDGLLESVRGSERRHGITSGLIACFLRDQGPAAAMETLTDLAGHAGDLLGVGLDSAEIGYPPAPFGPVFHAAAGMGLHRVAHAAEEGPPEYIWQALDDLGVERIDHGVRAVEDPALMRRLARDQIPITACPLSNVRLRCVATMADHPLPRMIQDGLLVTVNSDDPAYFGGYIDANYQAVAREFGLTASSLRQLAENSIRASFLTAAPPVAG